MPKFSVTRSMNNNLNNRLQYSGHVSFQPVNHQIVNFAILMWKDRIRDFHGNENLYQTKHGPLIFECAGHRALLFLQARNVPLSWPPNLGRVVSQSIRFLSLKRLHLSLTDGTLTYKRFLIWYCNFDEPDMPFLVLYKKMPSTVSLSIYGRIIFRHVGSNKLHSTRHDDVSDKNSQSLAFNRVIRPHCTHPPWLKNNVESLCQGPFKNFSPIFFFFFGRKTFSTTNKSLID